PFRVPCEATTGIRRPAPDNTGIPRRRPPMTVREEIDMRPQGGSGRLESMTEATWSRGLWHGLGGLPALIQAARAALADSRGRPLSLCIVQLAHPPVPAGENG